MPANCVAVRENASEVGVVTDPLIITPLFADSCIIIIG